METKEFLKYFIQKGLKIKTSLEDFKINLERKGNKRYYDIFEKLYKVQKDLTDQDLHDFYRYDIRVRRFLYRYITPIEVYYRAQVANENFDETAEIEELTFYQLINRYYNDNKNLSDIKELRNYVMHFRMIQLIDEDVICNLMNILFSELRNHGYGFKFKNRMIELAKDLNLIYRYYIKESGEIIYGMGFQKQSKRENEAS